MGISKHLIWTLFLLSIIWIQCQSDNGKREYSREEGKMIYKQFCITCHGASGKLQTSGAADLSQSDLGLKARISIIENGKGAMTPFGNILTEQQIEAVARYTQTINTE